MSQNPRATEKRPLPVVLVGPMGSGKSTLGKELALRMGYNFIDIDSEVERRAGMSIGDFFTHKGEAAFRCAEEQVLSDALDREKMVVSTGGGCVLSLNNRERMGEHSWVVYLSVSAENAVRRCEAAQESRPLLKEVDRLSAWTAAFEARLQHYQALANIEFNTDDQSLEVLLSNILTHWEKING